MNSLENNIPPVRKIYTKTSQILRSNPKVLIPFYITAFLELAALFLIFVAPRYPFKIVLGPPIRAFCGESFLHYPANFLLLPKLTSLSRMAVSIVFASLLTAISVAMVFDIFNKKHINLRDAFKVALKKYAALFTVVLLVTLLFYLMQKFFIGGLGKYLASGQERFLFIELGKWLGLAFLCLNFILAVFLQSIFIYAIPGLIINKDKLTAAIRKSIRLFRRFFTHTLILVGLPTLLYVPILLSNYNVAFLIDKFFPEFILVVSFLSIIIGSLVIAPIVTVSTTLLYLNAREK